MRQYALIALLVLGLVRMAADVLGLGALAGLAATTGAAPAPKVFSAVAGLETYSTAFVLEIVRQDGSTERVAITPGRYANVRGPYNRRNAYGAALAYGPVLASDPRTRDMFEAISRHALCGDAPLLREIGIDPADLRDPIHILLTPRDGTRTDLPLVLEVRCA